MQRKLGWHEKGRGGESEMHMKPERYSDNLFELSIPTLPYVYTCEQH
jgi:hypothetical protein